MTPDEVAAVLDEAELETGTLSVVLVAGATREQVLTALGAAADAIALGEVDWDASSAYSVVDVPGGALALELSGHADPSLAALARLSTYGGPAAVVRSNIRAQDRFGCARDGEVVFDADEYPFTEVEEKQAVPEQLRALFDSAWEDLDAEDAPEPEDAVMVGLAMATEFTGVDLTVEDVERVVGGGYHQVPVLTYVG